MIVPIPAPVIEHDFLTTVEYWAFRLALLIVFLSWLARHVIDELKRLRAAISGWRSPISSHPVHETPGAFLSHLHDWE